MRLFLLAILIVGFVTDVQAQTPCGPIPNIAESNLQSLIGTSAKSYAKSSSKENVLLQALLRDPSYFNKIFPKRDRNVIGGYYFNVVCRTLIEIGGGKPVFDALGREKLKYVARAFKNPPSTQPTLAKYVNASGPSGAALPTKKPAMQQAALGTFGTAVVEADRSQNTNSPPNGFATTVNSSSSNDEVKMADKPEQDGAGNEETAPMIDTAPRMPAVQPMAIPQGVMFPSSPEPEPEADDTQSGNSGSLSDTTSQAQDIYQTADDTNDADSKNNAGGSGPAEFDLTAQDSETGQNPLPSVLKTPSCRDMGLPPGLPCAKFEAALAKFKGASFEYSYPRLMQPGQKVRVSLVYNPTIARRKESISGAGPHPTSNAPHILRAELFGKAFDVEPKGPQQRVLNPYATVTWTWFVTPYAAGANETLGLDLGAVVNVDGTKLAPVTIKSYRNDIAVETSWWSLFGSLARGFDPLFLLTAFIGFGLMLALAVQRHLALARSREVDNEPQPINYASEFASLQPGPVRSEATMFLISESNNQR